MFWESIRTIDKGGWWREIVGVVIKNVSKGGRAQVGMYPWRRRHSELKDTTIYSNKLD